MADAKPPMKALPPPIGVDPEAVADYWRQMVRPGHVHEVRIPDTHRGPHRLYGVMSGYFDNPESLISEIKDLNGYDCTAIYVTLNPVNPDLIARAANRLKQAGKNATTSDVDIAERRNLLIDIDPVRPADISASDDERDLSLSVRDAIADFLDTEMSWPPPVATMETGNGGGLIYRIALPNTDEATDLVSRVLNALKLLFEDPKTVTVDTTMSNASRITKLVGTVAAKGDDVDARPWRRATAAYGPKALPVSIEQLEAVARFAGANEPKPTAKAAPYTSGSRDLAREMPDILTRAGIGYTERQARYSLVYKLDRCLTSNDHRDGACILAFPSGAVEYRCHHNRCQDKAWADVKEVLGIVPAAKVEFTVGGNRDRVKDAASRSTAASAGDRSDDEIAATYPPVPEIVYYGRFDAYRNIMGPTSEAPDIFHLGASLTMAGAMIGRRVHAVYNSEELYGNLYTVLVGPSGSSRKDTAIKRATNLPFWPSAETTRLITPSFTISRDVSSAEGLITVLKAQPNTFLYLTELSAMIKNARRKGTSTILDRLIEAWDTPEVLQNLNKLNPVTAIKPYLSIIAATQPGRLASEMEDEDLHSGFANRWLFLFGAGKEPMARPPSVDRNAAWRVYEQLFDAIHSYPEGSVIGWGESANKRWDEWYLATTRKSKNSDEESASMRVRHATLIQKIALIYAVTDRSWKVELHHLEPAIALVDWMWGVLKESIRGWGVSPISQLELKIEQVLKTRGELKRRDLQRACSNSRKWDSNDFARVIESMVKNGTVEVVEGLMQWSQD